jgi:peptidyl-prolyl cis-trans isomerase SurA
VQTGRFYYLAEILNILPPGPMTLEEAKVSVLTDYQEYLENQWVEGLKVKYPIKINEKGKKYVFEHLQK